MKLSSDQIKIIKSISIYVITSIIGLLLGKVLYAKDWLWKDFFSFAAVSIITGLVLGTLFVLGSKTPKK